VVHAAAAKRLAAAPAESNLRAMVILKILSSRIGPKIGFPILGKHDAFIQSARAYFLRPTGRTLLWAAPLHSPDFRAIARR